MVWIYSLGIAAGAAGRLVYFVPVAALAAIFLLVNRCRPGRLLHILLFVSVCFAHGFISRTAFQDGKTNLEAIAGGKPRSDCTLRCRVTGFPQQLRGGVRFTCATKLGGVPTRLLVSTVNYQVGYGDSLRVTGALSAGRADRRNYLYSRDVHGYLRVKHHNVFFINKSGFQSGLRGLMWRLHEDGRVRLARNLGTRCGIPSALFLGERGWIGKRLRECFTSLGINHLLALSGMHLGIIAGLLIAVGKMFGYTHRLLLLVVLTAYVLLIGETISLYRAYLMAAVLVLANRCERPSSPLEVLGTALLLVLLYRPGFVYSVAFQLSFAATFAVLLCVTRLPRRRYRSRLIRILAGVATSLAVSLCVQIFLLPIQLHYFDGVSLVTPLSTLLFLPAVAVVMLLTGLTLAVDNLLPVPGDILYSLLRLVVSSFEYLLYRAADVAPPLLKGAAPVLWVYYGGQAVLWFPTGALRHHRWRPQVVALKIALGTLVCACAFLCS